MEGDTGAAVDAELALAEAEWSSGSLRSALSRYDAALALVRADTSLGAREGVICLGKGFALLHGGGLDDAADGWRWAAAVECLERTLALALAEAGGHGGSAQAAFVGQLLGEARARQQQYEQQHEQQHEQEATAAAAPALASAAEDVARQGFVLAMTRRCPVVLIIEMEEREKEGTQPGAQQQGGSGLEADEAKSASESGVGQQGSVQAGAGDADTSAMSSTQRRLPVASSLRLARLLHKARVGYDAFDASAPTVGGTSGGENLLGAFAKLAAAGSTPDTRLFPQLWVGGQLLRAGPDDKVTESDTEDAAAAAAAALREEVQTALAVFTAPAEELGGGGVVAGAGDATGAAAGKDASPPPVLRFPTSLLAAALLPADDDSGGSSCSHHSTSATTAAARHCGSAAQVGEDGKVVHGAEHTAALCALVKRTAEQELTVELMALDEARGGVDEKAASLHVDLDLGTPLLAAAATAAAAAGSAGFDLDALLGRFEAHFVHEVTAQLGNFVLPPKLLSAELAGAATGAKAGAEACAGARTAATLRDVVAYIEEHCPAQGDCAKCPSKDNCSVHSATVGQSASPAAGTPRGAGGAAWVDLEDLM